ncbi:tandem-95 repeat protein, partial [Plesiomonas sp.]|uniref:tandem-95 repeat protein n=1 Tax=Plesiomonas sp. TaxID=2486279 RepID=UPI003F356858
NDGVRGVGDTLLVSGAVVSAADISKLTFRPTANANGAGYASFTWQVSDGTALSANTGTMTLNVTPVNDTPVISNTSVSKTVNENSVQTFNPADFGFSDVDSGDTLQSITIVTAPTTSELFIDANNDGVRDSGDTLLGNGAVVSAADISKLTFRPTANANGTGYASFTWQVNDGTALSANTGTMALNVTSVNDAPVISNTLVSKTFNEDSAQTFNPSDFSFSDVDSGDTLQSITIVTAPTAGELFIDANNDGVRSVGDILLVSGAVVSAADISKLTFRPTANANGAGYASFTWQVSDGTALSTNTGTMTLNVTPVNDAPVISNTSVSKTVNEDSAQIFNSADFGFSDVDSGDTLQSITIVTAPTAGELFIDANNDGVRGVGDTLLVSGAVVSTADISKLTFRPTANANGAGYASFTWQVSDGTALSANTGTMILNVTPVNDAPTLSSGDPQFRISDGANGPPPVDSRTPTIQSQEAGTLPLNIPFSLGSFNAGRTAGNSSIMASIFAISDGASGGDTTKSDVANVFRHGSSFGSHFESSLGSFPSFSKDPSQGGTSSLASIFSDIYLPSLTPMEVFTGGSWKDINLHAQRVTEQGSEQATAAFTPSFLRQLQHIGEAEGQRLSAIAQALYEQSQRQG